MDSACTTMPCHTIPCTCAPGRPEELHLQKNCEPLGRNPNGPTRQWQANIRARLDRRPHNSLKFSAMLQPRMQPEESVATSLGIRRVSLGRPCAMTVLLVRASAVCKCSCQCKRLRHFTHFLSMCMHARCIALRPCLRHVVESRFINIQIANQCTHRCT